MGFPYSHVNHVLSPVKIQVYMEPMFKIIHVGKKLKIGNSTQKQHAWVSEGRRAHGQVRGCRNKQRICPKAEESGTEKCEVGFGEVWEGF
jgi:hypothetical protein